MGIINNYPYTDMHSINLDYVIKLCRENMGLHLEISGDRLLLKTEDGKIISSVVISYATEANHAASATHATNADTATVAINANYASASGSSATADNAANATHAVNADHATSADTATTAASAASATSASSAVEAIYAVSANTARYADRTGAVEHADKALESVTVNGNQVRFTTYDGTNYDVTIPYAVKAANDDLNNPIKETYVANVVNDIQTGKLQFLDAEGNTIVELIPTVNKATNDSYDNLIADFIKAITVSSNSNYVTVTHGTGTADSLTIHYSETAWKDTNGNVIKNSYIKRLACEVDPNDHKYKLVAYNGDNPEAEIFRIELTCENAKHAIEADHATSADSATNAINANHAASADTATNCPNAFHSVRRNGDRVGFYNYNDVFMGEVFAYEYIHPYRLTAVSGTPFEILAASFTVGSTKAFTSEITLDDLENAIGYNKYLLIDFGETMLVMPTAIIARSNITYICFDIYSTDDNTHRYFELYTDTSDSTGLTVLIKRIS